MSRVHYRAVVYESDDTTVDFIIGEDDFVRWPERFGGQRVNILEGKVESIPFSFDIRAAGFMDEIVVGERSVALQRRIQFQKSPDGMSWSDVGGARIQQIELADDRAFRCTAIDERFVERNTAIFVEADTTAVFPPGEIRLRDPLNLLGGEWNAEVTASSTDGTANVDFPFILEGSAGDRLSQRQREIMSDDVRPGFEDRTLADGETRYQTLTLHLVGNSTSDTFEGDYPVRDIDETELPPAIANQRMEVLDPSGTLSPSTATRTGYLYLKKAPPSDDVPLHVPSDTVFFRPPRPQFGESRGIHPFQLVKDIYDGQYQQTVVAGSTETVSSRTVRYSTETLSVYDSTGNPGGLIDNPRYPLVRFRITESEIMSEFLQRSIFAPFGVLPVVDKSGKVRLTDFSLPTAETIPSTTTLFQFGSTNLHEPPSWNHNSRDQLTAIRFRYPRFSEGVDYATLRQEGYQVPESNAGIDLVRARTHEVDRRHPRLESSNVVRREVIREIPGTDTEAAGDNVSDIAAAELFERYADGPQVSRLAATTAASTVLPGDLVIVDTAGFPNTAGSTRGGSVMLQVTAKAPRPGGFTFDALHVGKQLQPLPTPTINVQRSGTDPRHTLRLSVSGYTAAPASTTGVNVLTHDRAVYQLADSTAAPATTDWKNVGTNGADVFTDVGDLKSGTKFFARARLVRKGRVGSLWSVADSTSTEALSAPTGLASTKQGATYIDLSWQNGEDDTAVEVLNPTTSRATLRAGSDYYRDLGLTVGTTHAYRVRHRDRFGGVSPATTKLSVATSTDPNDILQLSPPKAIEILRGRDSIVSKTTST